MSVVGKGVGPIELRVTHLQQPRNQQVLEQDGHENFGGNRVLVSSRLGQPVVDLEG